MRVIAFTGLPGSGKSVAVEAARARGIPVVRMGRFVLEEVARRGHPTTEEHIGPVATGMRQEHGDDVWARRTIEALRAGGVEGVDPTTRIVVVDGVRSLAEVARFRHDLGSDFTLIAIDAPDEMRHMRILGRGREDDAAEHALLHQRDERERGWGVDAAIRQADHMLRNDVDDVDAFTRQVASVLDRVLASTA